MNKKYVLCRHCSAKICCSNPIQVYCDRPFFSTKVTLLAILLTRNCHWICVCLFPQKQRILKYIPVFGISLALLLNSSPAQLHCCPYSHASNSISLPFGWSLSAYQHTAALFKEAHCCPPQTWAGRIKACPSAQWPGLCCAEPTQSGRKEETHYWIKKWDHTHYLRSYSVMV